MFLIPFIVTFAVGWGLVSQSRTKNKATKANEYIEGMLDLYAQNDTYLRKTKTSRDLDKK